MMSGLFFNRVIGLLGGVETDVNAVINDFSPGIYLRFGKVTPASSNDDWFHSELILFNMVNPVYTMMPLYHFWAEARYNGAEVVLIAPDCSPSHVHADYYFPVQPGTDAPTAPAGGGGAPGPPARGRARPGAGRKVLRPSQGRQGRRGRPRVRADEGAPG